MAEETTPLTAAGASAPSTSSAAYPGPVYVFPGGVSPRSRRQRMKQFKCCISITLLVTIVAAFLIALALSSHYGAGGWNGPSFFFVANESTAVPANMTALRAMMAATKMPITDEPEADWALRRKRVNRQEGEQAISAGIKALGDREILEEGMQALPLNSAAYRHYRSLSTNPEARKMARRGYVENQATMSIAERFNYTKQMGDRDNIGRGPRIVLPDPSLLHLDCNFNALYRRENGVCNNKLNPRTYGAAMIPYRRMVAPDYGDGIAAPRESNDASARLPPARAVSLNIHRSSYETDTNFTVMLAVFGQFLDHDITATSLTTSQDGESIDCCAVTTTAYPECFSVQIMPDDPYYQQYNITCMNFVRSAPAPTGYFGPRQQLNQATAFIDGSVVYGNLEQRQRHLRNYINGTLRMFITVDERELLPISSNAEDGCNRVQMLRQGKYCFESGDDRANENLLLTSMHLLWARQHNYLARGLSALNPTWDDEIIFQEARKILGAQLAHITYNEFLPILLGRDMAAAKGLLPAVDNLEAPDTYDRNVDAAIANCFASAAFRFAHTLLPGLFNLTRDDTVPEAVELHKMLFNPFSLWSKQGLDRAIISAANTPVLRVDRFFSLEITQKLFEGTAEDKAPVCGLDLVSLNIQRGRDHGIPAYPVFRKHCRLPPVDTWQQMGAAMDNETLQSIMEIYSSPHDVDLYTGALSETPLEGALFGPLLTCLISDQFLRLKMGDSHWYERKIGPQKLTKSQLAEIYKTTLSAIICNNADSIVEIHKYVMQRRANSNPINPIVNCSEIANFNFTPWSVAMRPQRLHRSSFNRATTLVRVMQPLPNNITAASTTHAAMGIGNVTLTNGQHA